MTPHGSALGGFSVICRYLAALRSPMLINRSPSGSNSREPRRLTPRYATWATTSQPVAYSIERSGYALMVRPQSGAALLAAAG
jgi:hypothetical protein